jgi:hypothetical protein
VMSRWYFSLHGIARAHIGPGTVIIDSTPKVILAATMQASRQPT